MLSGFALGVSLVAVVWSTTTLLMVNRAIRRHQKLMRDRWLYNNDNWMDDREMVELVRELNKPSQVH